MTKYCVLPYDEFWAVLDESGILLNLKAFAGTEEDTPENRRRAYNGILADLRARGALCEHPSHNHQPTEQ